MFRFAGRSLGGVVIHTQDIRKERRQDVVLSYHLSSHRSTGFGQADTTIGLVIGQTPFTEQPQRAGHRGSRHAQGLGNVLAPSPFFRLGSQIEDCLQIIFQRGTEFCFLH